MRGLEIRILILTFVLGCNAVPIVVQECTYKGHAPTGKILSIDIELPPDNACSKGQRVCDFTSEAVYNGTITFHASENSATAYSTAVATIDKAQSIFNVDPRNSCESGLKCPVVAGSNVTYKASVKVPCFIKEDRHKENRSFNAQILLSSTRVLHDVGVTAAFKHFMCSIRSVAKWYVIGDNDKALFCFVIPFHIHRGVSDCLP